MVFLLTFVILKDRDRMKRHFKVAEFVFSISVENDMLWKYLGNYAPFQVPESKDCLFEIEVTASLPQGNAVPFFVDSQNDPDMPCINVYEQAGGYLVTMAPNASSSQSYRFWTDKGFCKAMLEPWNIEEGMRFPLDNTAMIMFAMASASKNTLAMHASVTLCDGLGYLFLGKSGTGKSTHSRLWIDNVEGCSLLNDDNPVVRFNSDGRLMVYGTPWSGKTPCYKNASAPVGAFVGLAQYPENRIRRMTVLESLAVFYISCSGMRKLKHIADGMDNTIDRILESLPVYHLDCLPDREAAVLCHSTAAGPCR